MPISVICPGCGDAYDLGDDLAGRRCRCKGCGTVFRVPEASPVSTARGAFSGLDEGPALPRVSAPPKPSFPPRAAGAYEPDLPPPPRGPRPAGTRRSRSRGAGEADPLYRYGIGLVGFGILIVLLPLVGLQHRAMAILPEAGQAGIAVAFMLIGGILLAFSTPTTPGQRAGKSTGVGLLILGIGLAGWAFVRPNPPQPPPPQFGGPPPGMPGPAMPGAPPAFGGPPAGAPAHGDDESIYTLSNALAARASGPLGDVRGMGIDFRVTYRGSGRMAPGRTVWIVESPQTKAKDMMPRLQPGGGTLVGTLMFDRGDTGPFRTYLASESPDPGGRSLVKVSNTVDMVWRGDQGIGDAPSGFPTVGPPMPTPGPQPGGPMPGPQPPGFNGPRGPFGPRGPMPGPPPGFPRRPGRP